MSAPLAETSPESASTSQPDSSGQAAAIVSFTDDQAKALSLQFLSTNTAQSIFTEGIRLVEDALTAQGFKTRGLLGACAIGDDDLYSIQAWRDGSGLGFMLMYRMVVSSTQQQFGNVVYIVNASQNLAAMANGDVLWSMALFTSGAMNFQVQTHLEASTNEQRFAWLENHIRSKFQAEDAQVLEARAQVFARRISDGVSP